MDIVSFTFDHSGRERLKKEPSGSDWPVVYMIHDDVEAYIGETCSMILGVANWYGDEANGGDNWYVQAGTYNVSFDIEAKTLTITPAN